jgi:hypothetical protein
MRNTLIAAVLLVLVALAGFAVGARPVQAQVESMPFATGESVIFTLQGGASRTCGIEEIRGPFARCGTPSSATPIIGYGDR